LVPRAGVAPTYVVPPSPQVSGGSSAADTGSSGPPFTAFIVPIIAGVAIAGVLLYFITRGERRSRGDAR